MQKLAEVADSILGSPQRQLLETATKRNEAFYRGFSERFTRPFPGEKSEDFNSRRKPPVNVTRRIVDTFIANVYGAQVMRSFSDPKNQELMQLILKQNDGFIVDGMNWQKLAELTGLAAVVPRFDTKTGRFFTNAFGSSMVAPIPSFEDPKRLQAVVIVFDVIDEMDLNPKTRKKTIHEIWTHDEFAVLKDMQVARDEEGNEVMGDHNFDEIPVAFFKPDEDHESFIPMPPITNVVEMHVHIEEMLSTFAQVFIHQSFKIMFFRNPGTDAIVASPTKWLTSNNPEADLKVVESMADFDSLVKGIQFYLEQIGDVGEVPSFSLSHSVQAKSGVALKIEFMPHIQQLFKRKVLYKSGEMKLARLFVKLADDQSNVAVNTNEEAMAVAVDYPDLEIPRELNDEIAEKEYRLRKGLTNVVQLMLEENPEMDEKQARKEIEANLQTNKELRDMGMPSEMVLGQAKREGLKIAKQQAEETPPTKDVEA